MAERSIKVRMVCRCSAAQLDSMTITLHHKVKVGKHKIALINRPRYHPSFSKKHFDESRTRTKKNRMLPEFAFPVRSLSACFPRWLQIGRASCRERGEISV